MNVWFETIIAQSATCQIHKDTCQEHVFVNIFLNKKEKPYKQKETFYSTLKGFCLLIMNIIDYHLQP